MATPSSPGTPSKADMDLQFSFVESLKEVLGIKTRTTEAEKASLNISKQIITAVQNQNRELSDQKTISKQIEKNKNLQNKAAKLASLHSKNLGTTENINYNKVFQTANGQSYGASIYFDEVEVSGIKFYNVQGSITNSDLATPLLGMSFLQKFYKYEFYRDKLILTL